MKLHLYSYDLALSTPFRIAHGVRTVQPTMIVGLESGGHMGLGEATATSYYGKKVEDMLAVLENLRAEIETENLDSPEAFWQRMYPRLREHPFELCALDVAANDLFTRQKGLPLYQWWQLDPTAAPLTNYTIGIGPIEEMVEKIKAQPWPVYKVKLGTDHDLEIITALREVTDARFRVDANTAWTAEQTIALAPKLKELGVEFLEQPLKADDWEGAKEVFQHSALPVMADESCQLETDIEKCHGYFHGVNIKLMKCGGLTPARRMIQKARSLELKVMVGCMTESTVGISAIAHLAPLLDYVDMDGALLLKDDIATGVAIQNGKAVFPDLNGTGAELFAG
ncbi:MAG: dipeptide epimerase [Saprospiraceae bacterium]|nr:dipeptide epimerase [Saprospiraceae bacterium]